MNKKDWAGFFIGTGMLFMFIFFIMGIIVTILGGNNWELMQQSEKIMIAMRIDWIGLMFDVAMMIGGTIGYNILDNKEKSNG